jgi:hypothetical protein
VYDSIFLVSIIINACASAYRTSCARVETF